MSDQDEVCEIDGWRVEFRSLFPHSVEFWGPRGQSGSVSVDGDVEFLPGDDEDERLGGYARSRFVPVAVVEAAIALCRRSCRVR